MLKTKLSVVSLLLVSFILTYYEIISISQELLYITILVSHVLVIRIWKRILYYYYVYCYSVCQPTILFLISYIHVFGIYNSYVLIAGIVIAVYLFYLSKEFILEMSNWHFVEVETKTHKVIITHFIVILILIFIKPKWLGAFSFLFNNSFLPIAFLFWLVVLVGSLVPIMFTEEGKNELYLYILPQGFGWAVVYLFFARNNVLINFIFYIISGVIVYYYLKDYIHREVAKIYEEIKTYPSNRCLMQHIFKEKDVYALLTLSLYFKPFFKRKGLEIYSEHGVLYIRLIEGKG